MKASDIKKVLELHRKWLNSEVGGACANLRDADLSSADLRCANLSGADLSSADLRDADLRYANLSSADLWCANLRSANLSSADLWCANLRYANLRDADLRCADLRDADLRYANLRYADLRDADLRCANLRSADLSSAKGLLLQSEYIKQNFKTTDSGIIVYKTFSEHYVPNPEWQIEPGQYINEVVNFNRTDNCGCGVNVGTLHYVMDKTRKDVWECLIEWPDAAGIVVPYGTDGKIRAERVKLIRIISSEELSKGQDRE